ncbi:hypothetical protein B0I35DRAFT_355734 [Stachybotrys elegans]|uniref:Helicase ATP-binding domain-containing protein n=1 Tax=Stachybotrys elegans TaxID=80388 RepID=A0A8K0WPU5_9HYPO|nr:hypothetical protein B0I35DRAFT_355734 [Stachybotrys elegans]
MEPPDSPDLTLLESWEASLAPLRVDIVCDFAGKELFGIHGEALLAHCITAANVDFTDGFQLLHAVHSVEVFLSKLKQRGCNFHVLWFDAHCHLAVPLSVPEHHRHKYLLARTVLIEHFRTPIAQHGAVADTPTEQIINPPMSFVFPAVHSNEFASYIQQNCLHFVLCSRGQDDTKSRSRHIEVMYLFASRRYNLAFIDDVEFRSSKVYMSVVTSSRPASPIRVNESQKNSVSGLDYEQFASQVGWKNLPRAHRPGDEVEAREAISIIACASILKAKPGAATEERVAAFLVHITMLEHVELSQRACEGLLPHTLEDDGQFLEDFSLVSINLIQDWAHSPGASSSNLRVCDLVDGRLFRTILPRLHSIKIIPAARSLCKQVESLVGIDLSQHLSSLDLLPDESALPDGMGAGLPDHTSKAAVLPFSHPLLDSYLDELKLDTEQQPQESATHQKIFDELTHWHNAKNPLNQRHVNKRPEWWALKRNQRQMASTIAYSASLTNASGKNINPEAIIAHDSRQTARDSKKTNDSKPPEWKTKLAQRSAGKNARPGNKGGKEKAWDEAKSIQARNSEAKTNSLVGFLSQQCRNFDRVSSLVTRYLKANKYLIGLSNADREVIGGELSLYICYTLVTLLDEPSFRDKKMRASTVALLRSHAADMRKLALTEESAKQLQYLADALQIPMPPPGSAATIKRPPPFKADIRSATKELQLATSLTAREFQLVHCGPYLERSFDSAPDARVPFHPDAWQRQVLDGIDENKSLFVVAPTSAGKTFISFYAMKKILQANDDDVLVYVAPTKALVNQIAAEIQARFSKTYHGGGRSIWAIHTRDYRINNPTGCQVLVTVPHILQIMLLAPTNAQKPGSWSRRVKRIIFDEVHCIGQAEDGIIWEQLLLLAPCPIIALSATVGNPLEFKEWLASVQKIKGFDMEMVVHSTRYSDLRKFIYQPPPPRVFEGFQPIERLPIPGLDCEDTDPDRFVLLHPIGTIVNKSKESLVDISLEPRDCFELWRSMTKHEDASHPLGRELDPNHALPEMIKKSDVIQWESGLKDRLHQWMSAPNSPFDKVHNQFQAMSKPINGVENTALSTFSLLSDLRSRGALPAIIFNYDRNGCELILVTVLRILEHAEQKFRDTNPEWKKKVKNHELREAQRAKTKAKAPKAAGRRDDKDDGTVLDKTERLRDESQDAFPESTFDPEAPIEQFNFADSTKISAQELDELISSLAFANIKKPILDALRRGLGVHHAGMNRHYRQVVEILFRKGFLTAVVATGTLALGLNMPCKTVIFAGDSVFLTALSYRQASGRAGRRGFDLLGNVVFHGIPHHRVVEIMSSRLPDLKGQFPMSVTLILRLFGLLHGTNGSDYAVKAIQSLLTQSRLFLGGPSSQMLIKHHLRFSIEYLRRQNLLSASGVPLNFSGLVGHLYFTENAVFAFHSLLKEGYLHEICDTVNVLDKRKDLLLQLLLILCHLFCRIPCNRYMNTKWQEDVVHRSPSIVLLPRLPEKAEQILRNHNKETLAIFQTYVRTFVDQHLGEKPDNVLPFTNRRVGPKQKIDFSASKIPILSPTAIRSPFAALSGFTDEFETIHELCETVRSGVFLEEESIPYIPIYPHETQGVPFNAYILDFFKHGDMQALVRDNGIKSGDVWFRLKDFSLVLATIVTSIANFLTKKDSDLDDLAMMDVQDVGDILEEGVSGADGDEYWTSAPPDATPTGAMTMQKKPAKTGKKKKVVDSWEDEEDESEESDESSDVDSSVGDNSTAPSSWDDDGERGLLKVYKAFKLLQQEFDEKFRKEWA